jgi:hypothetical protein
MNAATLTALFKVFLTALFVLSAILCPVYLAFVPALIVDLWRKGS